MARSPVLAAGGIVLRQGQTPLIAVVRLRKRNEWVLPKGKLDDGETPRDAAMREVVEETRHQGSVHEFLGTLVYESGRTLQGRSLLAHGDPWRAGLRTDGRCEGGRVAAARRRRRAAVSRLRAGVSCQF